MISCYQEPLFSFLCRELALGERRQNKRPRKYMDGDVDDEYDMDSRAKYAPLSLWVLVAKS